MNRRDLLRSAVVGGASAIVGPLMADSSGPTSLPADSFAWNETTVSDLSAAIKSGKLTSASLTRQYLDRIKALDQAGPEIHAVIEVNPDALAIAESLDAEFKAKVPRGPLHGIPILIKDNIATHDKMMTTAGSLALLGSIPANDASIVRQLRQAGAVILGKTNLSEWANFRSDSSSSGWSGRGGLTKNPYCLDRNPSGSSSGSAAAVAANFCSVAIGTETDGSIVSPAGVCGIVGLKPTVGLVSRAGIIPISKTQDTAGPMTRTVRDAAILLGAIAGEDPCDPVTQQSRGKSHRDYTPFLDPDGLRGARIGVARQFFQPRDKGAQVIADAIATMQQRGAILIDPIAMPSIEKIGNLEFLVMLYEFKAGINAYLADLGEKAPVHSLEEVIAFNQRNAERELPYFGQEILIAAQETGSLTDKEYLDALEQCQTRSRKEGIDAVMDKHHLDAIIAPTGGPASKTDLIRGNRSLGGSSTAAAVAGYPNITVPAGEVFGLPIGLSFFGRAYSEPTLLKLAYGFEQATKARRAPKFLATVG